MISLYIKLVYSLYVVVFFKITSLWPLHTPFYSYTERERDIERDSFDPISFTGSVFISMIYQWYQTRCVLCNLMQADSNIICVLFSRFCIYLIYACVLSILTIISNVCLSFTTTHTHTHIYEIHMFIRWDGLCVCAFVCVYVNWFNHQNFYRGFKWSFIVW